MIKAPGRTADGRPLLLLGLSAENTRRLLDDKPIVVDLDQLGAPFAGMPSMVVLLVGGETEDAIRDQIATTLAAVPVATTAVTPEHVCPACHVERTDFEGPGWHLAQCPNCYSEADPVPMAGPVPAPTRIRCPTCVKVSYNPNDALNGWCEKCKQFWRPRWET